MTTATEFSVDPDAPPYIIAEIGANHNGDMALARQMIDSAKTAGAHAVKFQSWDTTIFSKQVYDQNYFLGDDYRERSDYTLREIVEEFSLDRRQLTDLAGYCAEKGIDFSSTPFNETQLNDLVDIGVPYIKIASMDLNNPVLLKAAAGAPVPVILSTGFGTLAEIDQAITLLESNGKTDIVVLHCVSLYPPHDTEVNLKNITLLRDTFGYATGFSDHTLGTEIALASFSLGSRVLEKHFTLDKDMFGWDHKVSADPDELAFICKGASRIYDALGTTRRTLGPREAEKKTEYRRSIISARKIEKGRIISADDLDIQRPGSGLSPMMFDALVGKIARHDIESDTFLSFDDLVSP